MVWHDNLNIVRGCHVSITIWFGMVIARPKPTQSIARAKLRAWCLSSQSSLSLLYSTTITTQLGSLFSQSYDSSLKLNQSPTKAEAKSLVKQNQLFMKIHEENHQYMVK